VLDYVFLYKRTEALFIKLNNYQEY